MPAGAVFFGYGELGVAGIDALVSAGARLVAVVVPSNRSGPEVDRVRQSAARHDVPLLVQPPRRDLALFVEELRAAAPDVLVVCSYTMILPAEILRVPAHGAVNVHGGLLPEYRGVHVAQWAIINGEREFGVTLHYIDEGIDTGPIIAERRFAVDETDDAASVRKKICREGSELLTCWWPRLADGSAPHVPQDTSRARYWPLRRPEDGRIEWVMSAESICRLVRALACNTPGAYVTIADRTISIRRAERRPPLVPGTQPGQVVAVNAAGVRVSAAQGDVLIAAVEIEGRLVSNAAIADLFVRSSA